MTKSQLETTLMEAVMANNYTTDEYPLVFKGPVKTFGVGGPNVLDMIGD